METKENTIEVKVIEEGSVQPVQTQELQVVETVATPEPVVPQNGTEQFIVTAIELGFALIIGVIVGLYIKFKHHPLVAKLNIDPETLKSIMNSFMETFKEQAKQEAVKKAREKDIKIPGVHNMTPEEIKEYEEKAKQALNKEQTTIEEEKK